LERGGQPCVGGWAGRVLGGKWAGFRRETETVTQLEQETRRKMMQDFVRTGVGRLGGGGVDWEEQE
jgi:hypothetical protein